MARNDDLVPCSQSEPLNDLVSSTDKEKVIWPAGHIGLAVSGRLKRICGREPLTGSSSAPIDTRQFRPNLSVRDRTAFGEWGWSMRV